MKRAAAPLLVVVILVFAACAPQPDLHGRPAFDRWVATHLIVVYTVERSSGCVDLACKVIALNDFDATTRGGDIVWLYVHEVGHGVSVALGIRFGTEPCGGNPYVCPPLERGAECIAGVVLGYDSPWVWWPQLGYGPCSPENLIATERALVMAGAW